MAEALTQAEIDQLLLEISSEENVVYEEVDMVNLICIYCRKIQESKFINLHNAYSNKRCRENNTGHRFVSEAYLRHSKDRQYPMIPIKIKRKIIGVKMANV